MGKTRKFAINILVALFVVAVIFYSYLSWKVFTAPGMALSFGQRMTLIFAGNPAETLSKLKMYGTAVAVKQGVAPQDVAPAASFSAVKEVIEKSTGKQIYFSDFGNDIKFNTAGTAIINSGTFVAQDGGKYTVYDYDIYLNATKAVGPYDSDHKAGIALVKESSKLDDAKVEKYKKFTAAALAAEKSVAWNKAGKQPVAVAVNGMSDPYFFQFSYTDPKTIDRIVEFGAGGSILDDKTEL
jgi:hypothetical protein